MIEKIKIPEKKWVKCTDILPEIVSAINELMERSNCGESAADGQPTKVEINVYITSGDRVSKQPDKLQRLLEWVKGNFIVPQDDVTPICVSRIDLKAKIKELMDEE